jgi:hypothetical protein
MVSLTATESTGTLTGAPNGTMRAFSPRRDALSRWADLLKSSKGFFLTLRVRCASPSAAKAVEATIRRRSARRNTMAGKE